MKKYVLILLIFLFSYSHLVSADDSDLFTTQANPNVLIILDNSNSMDEDFYGNAVGSFSPQSKTVVGKKALRNVIDSLKDKLRVGLMTYNLSGVSAFYLNNNPVFVSYDPKSYCPNPPSECVKYAQTGDGGAKGVCEAACRVDNPSFDARAFGTYFDEILNNYPIGTEPHTRYSNLIYPKTQRIVNPADPSRFIYFKHAIALYTATNWGRGFCYGTGYSPTEGVGPSYKDSYTCWNSKTGTNDDYPGGYSGSSFAASLQPTDSDYALGYGDFGKRWYFSYVGKTWFAGGSPGNGHLHVQADNLVDKFGVPTATYTNVRNKLDPKENDEAGYMSCGAVDKNTCSYILNAGLTPTAGTLQEALSYFKGDKSPIQAWCQKNFIIYVTDGLPSVNESGTGDTAEHLLPTVLERLDALRNIIKNIAGKDYNFDVRTYVLGVGLSDEAKLQLDEMALHGGTDVSGHAYYADKPEQLNDALNRIFTSIIESSYSFASPTVPSVRMIDKDILYLSSFTPLDKSPFWPGSLRAYQLNSDGTLPVDAQGNPLNPPLWDAGVGLKAVTPDARKIYTYARGAMRGFTRTDITKEDLAVATDMERTAVIDYVRGNVQDTYDLDHDGNTTEQRPWKLGDIFHSNPVIVGSPSQYFEDVGYSGTGGFYEKNKGRTKVIIVGANDGMLHAFDAATGLEKWAFIPNSLLTNLKLMQTNHTYYVDSTPKVADVWLDYNGDNNKIADEWRTVLVCGLRKGGKTYFALDITDTLNPKYLWEFPKSTDATTLSLVGQSWSEPAIGRVKVEKAGGLVERWVAFIGGGFDPNEKVGKDAEIGRAFFVVDMMTGDIIWRFSYAPGDDVKKWMKYSFPAAATAVDTNFDGYADKVYIGDLGGQMWVFDVSFDESTAKSESLWSGKRLFTAPTGAAEKHNIYYQPAVAFDKNGTVWVYFGTGDREDPNNKNSQERFYAVQVGGSGTYPLQEADLNDVTCPSKEPLCSKNTFIQVTTKNGWYIQLNKGEKVLARPAAFNRLVYFTTYTPETTFLCAASGVANAYVVEYLSGGGALAVDELIDLSGPAGARSKEIGERSGAPSAPVITVNNKGKASVIIGTTSGQILSEVTGLGGSGPTILFWREVIP